MSTRVKALSLCLGFGLFSCRTAPDKAAPERVPSADGVPIAYDVRGSGETTLVQPLESPERFNAEMRKLLTELQ